MHLWLFQSAHFPSWIFVVKLQELKELIKKHVVYEEIEGEEEEEGKKNKKKKKKVFAFSNPEKDEECGYIACLENCIKTVTSILASCPSDHGLISIEAELKNWLCSQVNPATAFLRLVRP